MKARAQDPRRLDVATLAAQHGECSGRWPLAGMARFVSMLPAGADSREVHWHVQAALHKVPGSGPCPRLHLQAHATVRLPCQRCLEPVEQPLEVSRDFVFVRDEATAQMLDADSDDEVLAIPARLDLHELFEDELIMALPLVPRHDACQLAVAPDGGQAEAGAPATSARRAFAALGALRKPPRT
jgi:uncharacterized protein